jgi:hypothetical protein
MLSLRLELLRASPQMFASGPDLELFKYSTQYLGHLHKYSSQVHICVALRMQSLSLKAPAISAFRDRCVTILTRSAQIFFSGSDLCSLQDAEFGLDSPSDFCVSRFLRQRSDSTASIWIVVCGCSPVKFPCGRSGVTILEMFDRAEACQK